MHHIVNTSQSTLFLCDQTVSDPIEVALLSPFFCKQTEQWGVGQSALYEREKSSFDEGTLSKSCLNVHRHYLIKRIQESGSSLPPAAQLFREIQARGYQESLHILEQFLRTLPLEKCYPETSLEVQKDYLIKRIEKAGPYPPSAAQLFREIQARGYRQSLTTLKRFLRLIAYQKSCLPACLNFHKSYLIKRIRESRPKHVPVLQLFREIRAEGYRGSLSAIKIFLKIIPQQKENSPFYLEYYKNYLNGKVEGAAPHEVSSAKLIREIQAEGYQGSAHAARQFLQTLKKGQSYAQCLQSDPRYLPFHKIYLIKRIKETYPNYVRGGTLFEEIKVKGYAGSPNTVRKFVIKVLKDYRPSTARLDFHKDYLIKRIEETYPQYATGPMLFEEIKARGYTGSIHTVRAFLVRARKEDIEKREDG